MRIVQLGLAILVVGCGDSGGGGGGGGASNEGGAPAEAPVQCATESCDECCLNDECATLETCEGAGESAIVITCDGPEDCDGGQTCCAGLPAGGSFPIVSSCTPPAECEAQGAGSLYFCHMEEDCGSLSGCSPWDLAPYVNVCGE